MPALSPSTLTRLRPRGAGRRNLVDHSEDPGQWLSNATGRTGPLGLNALGRFSGHALASLGSNMHRDNAVELVCATGETLCTTMWVRAGSSERIRLVLRDMDAKVNESYAGELDALPAAAGLHLLVADDLLEDGLTRRITVRSTVTAAATVRLGLGPDSAVSGEDLIFLALQIERGAHPTPYQAQGL